jgi:hypothetical protein
MDSKQLVYRLVSRPNRARLVGLIGCIFGLLPDGDHPLYRQAPALFGLFGAGGRPLHIPLLLGSLSAWSILVSLFAGLGMAVWIRMNKEKFNTLCVGVWASIVTFSIAFWWALIISLLIWAWPIIKLFLGA